VTDRPADADTEHAESDDSVTSAPVDDSLSYEQARDELVEVVRALESTHAAGGVHRDVKGANVLVRPGDGRAFLTDFGAGHYRGAATLTSKLLPPGTPNYRSPEAWAYQRLFTLHPSAHYRGTQHPLIRSMEAGEDWGWCYPDQIVLAPVR